MTRKSGLIRRVITYEKAVAFAKEKGFEYYEVSAKDYINIDEVFIDMTKIILSKIEIDDFPIDGEPGIKIGEFEEALRSSKKLPNVSDKSPKVKCCLTA